MFGNWPSPWRSFRSGATPFFYSMFQGTYKLRKMEDIDMKKTQKLHNYPTHLVPVRPVINSIGDWRKRAAYWIGQ
eukprot:2470331-Pyramimonas_sp.AAC.1